MFSGGADPKEVAAQMGLPVELISAAEGYADTLVHPDCWPPAMLLRDLTTQWRVGPGGVVGLDYSVLPAVMDLRSINPEDRGSVFDDLQTMEHAVLELVSSKKG